MRVELGAPKGTELPHRNLTRRNIPRTTPTPPPLAYLHTPNAPKSVNESSGGPLVVRTPGPAPPPPFSPVFLLFPPNTPPPPFVRCRVGWAYVGSHHRDTLLRIPLPGTVLSG